MANLEDQKSPENLIQVPFGTTFENTSEVLDEDPELEKAREIIEWLTDENDRVDEITKLTPELAWLLNKKFQESGREHLKLLSLTTIDVDTVNTLWDDIYSNIHLWVEELSIATEIAISKLSSTAVFCKNLRSLKTVELANKLVASIRGTLKFDYLESLWEWVADALGTHDSDLLLPNMKYLSEWDAKWLAKCTWKLELWIEYLWEWVADALGEHKWDLSLPNLKSLKVLDAKWLAGCTWTLFLDNLSLDDSEEWVAEALWDHVWDFHLPSIESLTDWEAEWFAKCKWWLFLDKFSFDNCEAPNLVAEALGTHKWNLYLPNIKYLTEWEAKWLAGCKWALYLDWLLALGSKLADAFGGHEWDIYLPKITGISTWEAEWFAKHAGLDWKIYLKNLVTIRDEDLELLIPVKSSLVVPEWIRERLDKIIQKKKIGEKMDKDLKDFQREIEGTKERKNLHGRRGNILYDRNEWIITSWGNGTKVEKISEENDSMKLEWLNLKLTMQEWVWLANLKNKVKHMDKKVSFRRSYINRWLNLEKTLHVNKTTMLIKRETLNKHIPACEDDEVVEKICEWLNK